MATITNEILIANGKVIEKQTAQQEHDAAAYLAAREADLVQHDADVISYNNAANANRAALVAIIEQIKAAI